MAVMKPFAAQGLKHRLHHPVVADEQDAGLRMRVEPAGDAAQATLGEGRPGLGFRRQNSDQLSVISDQKISLGPDYWSLVTGH